MHARTRAHAEHKHTHSHTRLVCRYLDVGTAVYWYENGDTACAALVFFLWLRLFKFFAASPWLGLFQSVVAHAASALLALAVVLLLLLVAFAHSGLVAFGSNVPELSTAPRALFFTFRHLLVAMDYDKIAAAAPFAGPAFYCAYAIILSLVAVRFVVAIFVDSYAAVMSRAPPRLWVFPPLSSLILGVKSWFFEWGVNARHALLVASKRAARAERAAAGIDVAHEYTPTPLASKLIFCIECDDVFRYDVDIDGAVAPRAAARARREKAEGEGEGGEGVAAKDVGAMYLVLRERVAKMEEHVDERLNKVEAMLCSTLLPLAKSLDQLVQQNVDQVMVVKMMMMIIMVVMMWLLLLRLVLDL